VSPIFLHNYIKIGAWEQLGNLHSAEHERLGGIQSSGHPTQQNQAGIFAHHANEELKCSPSSAAAGLWLFSALPTIRS